MKCNFYCVNTSYPMDNMLNRLAQTGPPNVRKRRPVFPPAGRSSHCTRQVACRTSFLSRQADVIASFSFGACTAWTNICNVWIFYLLCELLEVRDYLKLCITSSLFIDHYCDLFETWNTFVSLEVRFYITFTYHFLTLRYCHVFSQSA